MKPQRTNTKRIQKAVQNERGFTLIDVAILSLVIGLIIAPFLQSYNTSRKRLDINITDGNFAQINSAISAYYFDQGYYPCPADPTLGPDDANFGQENRTDDGNPATVDDCVTNAGNVNLPNPGDIVMWGAVPHKALKLNVDQILDSQRRKITYSVTTAKTKDTTFNNPGVLQTRTVNDNPNCEAPPADITVNAVHLTLVSGGEDGAGAYDINGNLFAACNTTGTPTLDSENCDRDTLFVFPKCALNTNSNPRALFYDDLVSNQPWTSVPSRIWDDASDPTNIGSVVGFIGIATGNPEYPVDVAGNIRTSNSATDASKQGNVHASSYCTVNGAECFEPSSIADYDPRMNCDSEKGMSGIGSNQAKCSNIIPNGKKSSCPSGQFATGLTAGGAVICSGS